MSIWLHSIQMVSSEVSRENWADGLQYFVAPIAAALISVVALKFVAGDSRSLVGFVGFIALAVMAFALIMFGGEVWTSLTRTVDGWTEAGVQMSRPVLALLLIVAVGVGVVGLQGLYRRRGRSDSEMGSAEGGSPKNAGDGSLSDVRVGGHVERAMAELGTFFLRGPRPSGQIYGQVQLAIVVAEECGLFGRTSPVTPLHVAKWQILLDRWPDLADELRSRTDILRELEEATAVDFSRDVQLFSFLKSGPRLHPVVERLLFLAPTSSERDI